MLCAVFVWVQEWAGWTESLMILFALLWQGCMYIESMEGSLVPMILSAVFMTPLCLCSGTIPDSDACGEGALYQSSIGLGERVTLQSSFPQQSDKV